MTHEEEVIENKRLRKELDGKIQEIKSLPHTEERSIALQRLVEAVMWLGLDLKRLKEPDPYPNSKDPLSGDFIEPTADNLKLL